MSDEIRRDYARLSGSTPPESLFGARKKIGTLLYGLLLLVISLMGFWAGTWVKLTLVPTVESGTVIICDADGEILAFTTPGSHFCPSGKWTSFRLHERFSFSTEVRFRDGSTAQIQAEMLYQLPENPEKLADILWAASNQMDFNEGVVRGNGVRQLQLVFSQVDSSMLVNQENLQRIGDVVAARTRDELKHNWDVTVESFWFTGTGRAFSPRNFENQKFEHTI